LSARRLGRAWVEPITNAKIAHLRRVGWGPRMGSPARNSQVVRFADFVLDLQTAELRRNGDRIILQDQPFQILAALLEKPGNLVTREELIKRLWPSGTFVDFDQSLNKAVGRLRDALGDRAETPRFVETLPRKGYRWIGTEEVKYEISSPEPQVQAARGSGSEQTKTTVSAIPEVHKLNPWLRVSILVVVLGAIAWGVYAYTVSKSPPPFQRIEITQVTGNGKVKTAAISPDGRYVGYVVDEGSGNPFFGLSAGGKESLWVRQVAGGNEVRVAPAADVDYKQLTFSHDGNFLYFIRSEEASSVTSLYNVPVLGGTEKRLMSDLDDALTFSPDGKEMAFVRLLKGGHTNLVIANEDGSGERILGECKSPPFYCVNGVAWSPNGRTIVTDAFWGESSTGRMSPVEFSVQSGSVSPLTSQHWAWVGNLGWLPDGRGLVVNAMDLKSAHQQIEFLSHVNGQTRWITTDTSDYLGVSLTADSKILATVQQKLSFDAWTMHIADPGSAKPINAGGNSGETTWSPDGKIVFQKIIGRGEMNIWVISSDGSQEEQMTANEGRINVLPHVSPDNRFIVFVSERTGSAHVWRMDIDGSNPKQLTDDSDDYPWFGLAFTPDSKSVVYTRTGANDGLWEVSVEGGKPTRLNTSHPAYYPAVSPDGRMLAYYCECSPGKAGVEVVPLDGAYPMKRFKIANGTIRWTPDSRSLVFIKNESGVSNLWNQPISGEAPRPITHFNNLLISQFDLSRDGKELVMSRGTANRDVVLVRDLR
jgi:Tol biopolymer transport system component/DNA-binding winged helix-turn-helix (wHTH) protein